MSSHIVPMNTQEVRETNKKRKKKNKKKNRNKQKVIEQRNPYVDQGQSFIRSNLLKLQQEEIDTYEFKYFSNKPKTIFNTSFSTSFRNDILRFSGEDTLFTPTFLGKSMTVDESDESSEEGTKILIEIDSSSEEESDFKHVDNNNNIKDVEKVEKEEKEEKSPSTESEEDLETMLKSVTFPSYDRASFKFTPIQSSSELYDSELTLKDYQLEAINFLFKNYCEKRPSCLAHEMGLGKTIISLSTLNTMYKKFGVYGPFLIVVPLITLPNWEREAKKWIPHFTSHTAWGTSANGIKGQVLRNAVKLYSTSVAEQKPLVVLTTYEFLKEDVITNLSWACVVFDEAHRLKSQKTQARKYVNQMKKEHFILLTGTPMQNSPQELWSLLNLMDPIAFKKYKLFEEKYGELESETAITNLKTAIAPYLIRRTKSQVLNAEMPPKEEILIEIELSSIQKSVYRAIVERKVNFFRKQFASKQDLTYIVNNLRYCCNHPCLISGMEEYLRDEQKRDDKGILIYSSSKMVVVHKLLKKFRDANEKALILSQFLDMLDILESYLQYEKIKYVRIDGSIPSEERQQHIDKFQTDPECRVFLLSTKISQGINLTAANHVIIYDSDFNPFNDSQAAARAHRIGQTKKVFVYRLVTKDSYEKYIISRASKKLGREKLVLAESDKSDEDLTAEEMERMIKFGVYSMFLNKDENANKDNELLNTDIDKILEGSSKIGVEGEDDGVLVDVMNRVTGNDKPIEKVPEKQAPNEVIKSVYFVPVAEVSDVALDDPHFWDKTFPDYCDIYTLQARLDDIKPFEASEFESYFKKLEHVATEAINRKQVVSDDTEKLAKVVEEDKRGLPTKTQLHNFLLKFNSRKHNSFYHCLKQEHFDQIQKWLDQLETKTLRNKKVWASSADDIQEIKKEKSGSGSGNTGFMDMDSSDEDFDASSSDEVQTDDEFECDQEELEKETEELHHLNIKIAPPAKKQKNSLNDRSILEKDPDDEKAEKSDTERPHKAPHKKPRRTNKKELKFTPYNVGIQNPPLTQIKPEVKPEVKPEKLQTKAEKDPYSMKNQTTTVHQNNWHNTVPLQPSLHNTAAARKPTQTVPQPSSSSVATSTTTNQTANQAQLQLLEGLFKKAGVNNVVTKIQQPPSDPVPQEKRRTILLDPTKPQGNQSTSNPKPSQPLVPLTNLSTTEILSRLSQAPNSIMEPLPKIPKQPAYQKLVAQQQQPTQLKPNPTVIPPKKASALILQQQNIQQQQMQTEKLLELLTKNTLKPPTQTPVVQPSTVNRSNANPSVANQQPIQPASRSTTRLASFTTLTTPQTTMNQQNQVHNPTPQPYLKDLVDPRRSAQGYTRSVVPVTNYQPQPPMNQNVSNQTASEPHVQQSAAFFRSLRHDPGSFQQMIQTMSLTNLKALGEQYFKNYSALKSNYWGNDKQQLIASSINLLTIINSQVQKIHAQQQQQQQQQQLQNNPFPQAFRTNPFAPPNATTPTTTNTTYQAYYTQSDGTRTMTSSSTTTIQQNAAMPNMNQTIVPNNANTAALTPQPQQQGRVGIEYYRSIISQNNQNGQTSTTRVQSTTSVAPSLNNTTALQQLPPPTSTTSTTTTTTTTPTSTEVPSLVDFSNDNTNYINNWFNFEH